MLVEKRRAAGQILGRVILQDGAYNRTFGKTDGIGPRGELRKSGSGRSQTQKTERITARETWRTEIY
jgi:hypothetical protein